MIKFSVVWTVHVVLIVTFYLSVVKSDELQLETVGNQTYYISGVAQKKNWFAAFEYCRSKGLKLISIENEWKLKDLVKHLHENHLVGKIKDNNRGRWWSDGTDLAQEGSFKWFSTGNTMRSFGQPWWGGRPDNYQNKEHCLEIIHRHDIWEWNDVVCNAQFQFICEPELCGLIDVRAFNNE